jgi:hypothetical protein
MMSVRINAEYNLLLVGRNPGGDERMNTIAFLSKYSAHKVPGFTKFRAWFTICEYVYIWKVHNHMSSRGFALQNARPTKVRSRMIGSDDKVRVAAKAQDTRVTND